MLEPKKEWTRKRLATYGIFFLVVVLPLVIALTLVVDFLGSFPFGYSGRWSMASLYWMDAFILAFLVYFAFEKDTQGEKTGEARRIIGSLFLGVFLAAVGFIIFSGSTLMFAMLFGSVM